MSMFRKAASVTIPATDELAGDAIADHDVAPTEEALPTTLPAQATVSDVIAPKAASEPKALRIGSKGAALLALLLREEGASLDEMTERTGWQPHTVRAAMTGLRKKGHVIAKRMTGNCTIWFIAGGAEA